MVEYKSNILLPLHSLQNILGCTKSSSSVLKVQIFYYGTDIHKNYKECFQKLENIHKCNLKMYNTKL